MVELDPDQIFLIALLIVLALVVFFELRFMRSRNKDYVEKIMDKDDTYNSIVTTRAIANALKQKGRDTREAELEIVQAEQYYKRGNFISSRDSAKKARDILINAPMIEIDVPKGPTAERTPETTFEKDRKTVQEVKRLEPNMMESRFIISSCQDRLQTEECSGMDLAEAREHLARAEVCYEEHRYDEAFREGVKAKKIMDEPSETHDAAKDTSLVKVPKPQLKCSKCANPVSAEDSFCRKCGTAIVIKRNCSYCQAELAADDVYCPKCGRHA